MSRPRFAALARAIGLAGGLLFSASLVLGLLAYATTFGSAPGPWFTEPGVRAVARNVGVFALFGLHHSLFARQGVKNAVARLVTPALERSSYVWVASLLFVALIVWWVPVPGLVWQAPAALAPILYGLQMAGVLLTGYASYQLGVFDLAGIRQAFGRERPPRGELTSRGAYGVVRHPIYFAWLLMVWPAPFMTGSRLTFAIVSTLYLVLAVPFEERSLRREFGAAYTAYEKSVRWRILPGLY